MISQKDYNFFNLKINRIIRDCYIQDPEQETPEYVFHGNSSQTKDNTYYYNKRATNHANDLLELCRFLPKLQNVLAGTAGTISYSSLLSDTKVPGLLKKQFVTADHFINLAFCNGLIIPEKVTLSNGDFMTNLNLRSSIRDKMLEKTGQEPYDN